MAYKGIVNSPADMQKYANHLLALSQALGDNVRSTKNDIEALGDFAKDKVYSDTKDKVLDYAAKLLKLSEEMERFAKYTIKKKEWAENEWLPSRVEG
jgi:hypothetical protein